MDEILLFILILAPGLVAVMARKYVKKRKRKKLEGYEELYYMAAHGFVVFGILSLFNYLVFHITSISELLLAMNRIDFFFLYCGSSASVAVLWILAWEKFGSEWLNALRSKLLRKRDGVTTSTNPSVWDMLFTNKELTEDWMVVSIVKDGVPITAGILKSWNPSDSDVMELELIRTESIKKVLEMDQGKERQEDMILNIVKFEYYCIDTGHLIKFYDTRKLKERKVLERV